MTPEATLERAGVLLPTPHPAVGTYVMAARTGLLFVSGHGAFDGGRPNHIGRLGEELNRRRDRGGGGGDAEPVGHRGGRGGRPVPSRPLRESGGLRQPAPHYAEQHVVADGATDLLVRTFGDRIGRPARSAVGVAALPLGFAVEIEAIVEASS